MNYHRDELYWTWVGSFNSTADESSGCTANTPAFSLTIIGYTVDDDGVLSVDKSDVTILRPSTRAVKVWRQGSLYSGSRKLTNSSCLQKSAWQASACRMSHAVTHHHRPLALYSMRRSAYRRLRTG